MTGAASRNNRTVLAKRTVQLSVSVGVLQICKAVALAVKREVISGGRLAATSGLEATEARPQFESATV